MNSIIIQKNFLDSQIVNEDYFAVKVVYDPSVESTKYVGFYFGDTDLLEFAIDRENNIVKRFQLVLCNHFEILDSEFLSTKIVEEGGISIDLPQHNECNDFNVRVYKNAVNIKFSCEPVQKTIKWGKVLYGITGKNDLAVISVIEMSEKEIVHAVEELKLGVE